MASAETNRLLERAIELAQAGRYDDARPLLKEVLVQDPSLPLAWLWLAAVSTDDQERIGALQRVLALDPTNERAREALESLGVVEGELPVGENPAIGTPAPMAASPESKPSSPFLSTLELIIIGVVLVIAVLLVGSVFVVSEVLNQPTETPTATNTATVTATVTPSITPTPSQTFTPLPPRPTLPPLVSPTPTNTAAPTNTPVPIELPPTATPIQFPTTSPTPRSEIFGG